jgi:uncharacterized protein (TIGR00251 family)
MSAAAGDIQLTERDGGVEFCVKVVPGSSRTQISGVWGTALRVNIAAPPEAGKANKEVVRLLAAALDVKRGDVAITHGQTQPLKRVHICGSSADQVRRQLKDLLGAAE